MLRITKSCIQKSFDFRKILKIHENILLNLQTFLLLFYMVQITIKSLNNPVCKICSLWQKNIKKNELLKRSLLFFVFAVKVKEKIKLYSFDKYLETPIPTEVNIKEIRRLEAKILNFQQKLETIKEEMNSLESDKDALQETEQKLNQRNRDLENKLVALKAELDRTRSANNANDEDVEKLLQVKPMIPLKVLQE